MLMLADAPMFGIRIVCENESVTALGTSKAYLTYAQIIAGVKERAKNYPKPELFKMGKLSKDVDGLIEVRETDQKHYQKAIDRLRKIKGY